MFVSRRQARGNENWKTERKFEADSRFVNIRKIVRKPGRWPGNPFGQVSLGLWVFRRILRRWKTSRHETVRASHQVLGSWKMGGSPIGSNCFFIRERCHLPRRTSHQYHRPLSTNTPNLPRFSVLLFFISSIGWFPVFSLRVLFLKLLTYLELHHLTIS